MHNLCFLKIKPWLDHDLEICSSVKPMKDELMFYNIKTGQYSPYFDEAEQKMKQKRTCTQSIQPIILHTHPYRSYSYPSIEDIEQVLALNIKGSFVLCNWGIWYMQKNDENSIYRFDEKLRDKLYDYLDDLGIETHNSAYSEKNDKHKSIFYGKKVRKHIRKFLNRFDKLDIPMKIFFICWNCHDTHKVCLDENYRWINLF